MKVPVTVSYNTQYTEGIRRFKKQATKVYEAMFFDREKYV